MKKQTISILLVIVMVLTLTTACVGNTPDAQSKTTEIASITTVESTAEASTSVEETTKNISEFYRSYHELKTLSSEEISAYMAELVRISETETLSPRDMECLGICFKEVKLYNQLNESASNMDEFKIQATKAFNNCYEQAIKENISLNELYSWVGIPVAEILYKYFSSDNFSDPDNIGCYSFYELSEEDAFFVAKAMFSNPVFALNEAIAVNAIQYPSSEIQEMGWAHFIAISATTNPEVAQRTWHICYETLAFENLGNQDKVFEISRNIINNPNHDIIAKYSYFCNHPNDDNIYKLALENLFEMARNADKQVAEQIKQLIDIFYDSNSTEAANKLLETLKNDT